MGGVESGMEVECVLYAVTWRRKREQWCVFKMAGGFMRQGSGEGRGEARSGDVVLKNARGVGSGSPGGAKRQGRGLGGGRTEGAGQWARVASSGLLGPCKSGSRVLSLFYCKGTTEWARAECVQASGRSKGEYIENKRKGRHPKPTTYLGDPKRKG